MIPLLEQRWRQRRTRQKYILLGSALLIPAGLVIPSVSTLIVLKSGIIGGGAGGLMAGIPAVCATRNDPQKLDSLEQELLQRREYIDKLYDGYSATTYWGRLAATEIYLQSASTTPEVILSFAEDYFSRAGLQITRIGQNFVAEGSTSWRGPYMAGASVGSYKDGLLVKLESVRNYFYRDPLPDLTTKLIKEFVPRRQSV